MIPALTTPPAPIASLALKLRTQGRVSSADVGTDLSLSCDGVGALKGASGNIRPLLIDLMRQSAECLQHRWIQSIAF